MSGPIPTKAERALDYLVRMAQGHDYADGMKIMDAECEVRYALAARQADAGKQRQLPDGFTVECEMPDPLASCTVSCARLRAGNGECAPVEQQADTDTRSREWPACATYPNLGCVCRGALQANKATCTRKRTRDFTPLPTAPDYSAGAGS